MNLTEWVDVAIGLSLVYLGASLFVTVINEYVAQALNLRGRQLCDSLKTLFNDKRVKDILAQSPALKPFFETDKGKAPSYVDPNVLARLLVGGLADPSAGDNIAKQVSGPIDKLPDSDLKTQLQALVRTTGTATDDLVKAVSDWADRSLTVLGEGYKRNLQKISFVIGLTVAIVLNIDTVTLTAHLYRDKDAREAAVTLGAQIAEKTDKETFDKCMRLTPQKRKEDETCAPLMGLADAVQGRNESLGKLPIGWPLPKTRTQTDASGVTKAPPASTVTQVPTQGNASGSMDLWPWATRVVGWLLTALALSLGAPFWFELLNKVVNMRYGMRRPEVKEERTGK